MADGLLAFGRPSRVGKSHAARGGSLELVLGSIVTAVVTVTVFSFIPFVWWLAFWRKEENFLSWIGLTVPRLRSKVWVAVLFAAAYWAFYNFDVTIFVDQATQDYLAASSASTVSEYAGMGFSALIPAAITTILGNGLGEEIFFRGFVQRRLIARLGSWPGIIVAAVLFGLMHNALLLLAGLEVSIQYHLVTFVFGAMAGLLLGIANEKIFDGSTWPSVLIHGLGNFASSIVDAF